MISSVALLVVLSASIELAVGASSCPDVLSCSSAAAKADSCFVPTPGGLLIFKQRFEPDVGGDEGRWGVDGLEVLDCETETGVALEAVSPSYHHEQISSFCLQSDVLGGQTGFDEAESEWAQNEVGEGVEELWERSWNTAGRFISTLGKKCISKSGQGCVDHQVASYFHQLHTLHQTFPTADLLSNSDITPSSDTTYSLNEIVAALTYLKHKPIVECDNMTLSSILWPLKVQGTFQTGSFVPAKLSSRKSSCPSEGIIYPPSTALPTTTTTHTWDPIYRPTPRAITLEHDEAKMAYLPEHTLPPTDPRRLGVFKMGEEEKEERKEDSGSRRYIRDEL